MLERLAKNNAEKVRIIKVNAATNRKWAQREGVRAVPSFKLYNGGLLMTQFAGAYSESVMQGKIDRYAMAFRPSSKTGKTAGKSGGKDGGVKKESSIRPMPKNWVPAGVTSE